MSSSTNAHILAFAETMAKHGHSRKRQKPVIQKKDLFVPLTRIQDLRTFKQYLEQGLVRCSIAQMNRKATAGEMKAVKLPGSREWHALPEWIEEFNNGWLYK